MLFLFFVFGLCSGMKGTFPDCSTPEYSPKNSEKGLIDHLEKYGELLHVESTPSLIDAHLQTYFPNKAGDASPRSKRKFILAHSSWEEGLKFSKVKVSYKIYKDTLEVLAQQDPKLISQSKTNSRIKNKKIVIKVNFTNHTAKRFFEKIIQFDNESLWWETNACFLLNWDFRKTWACENDLASIWVASFLFAYDRQKLFNNETAEAKLNDLLESVSVEPLFVNKMYLKDQFVYRRAVESDNLLFAKKIIYDKKLDIKRLKEFVKEVKEEYQKKDSE